MEKVNQEKMNESIRTVDLNKSNINLTRNNNDETVINLAELLEVLLNRLFILIVVTLLAGAAALGGTYAFITPKYQSSVTLYVNSSSLSVGASKIDLSELNTSKSLSQTYAVILKSRTTLQAVIDKLGLRYGYKTLGSMITTGNVDNTEVFRVTVTSSDANEAAMIANGIVDILPNRINSIMEGSSVRIVDTAIVDNTMVSPDYRKNTMIGAMLGFVLTAGIIILRYMLDTTIHSDDYLLTDYANIPLLTVIPLVDGGVDK